VGGKWAQNKQGGAGLCACVLLFIIIVTAKYK